MFINELRTEFEAQKVSKAQYIENCGKVHQNLFDYADLLPQTAIDAITIKDGKVLMHSRLADVTIESPPGDLRSPPLEALNFGSYENTEHQMMFSLLEPKHVIFDIGANIGWFTCHYACCLKMSRVFGFEPIPSTFYFLQKNIARNVPDNTQVFNFAFGEEDGSLSFFYTPRLLGSTSSVKKDDFPDAVECKCPIYRIDSFVAEHGVCPDFIKCDVEGAEFSVFRGAENLLKTNPPVIFSEMLRKWAACFDYHPNDMIAWLAEFGYHCFSIAGERLCRFERMTKDTIETNFVFLHGEKHSNKIDQLT